MVAFIITFMSPIPEHFVLGVFVIHLFGGLPSGEAVPPLVLQLPRCSCVK